MCTNVGTIQACAPTWAAQKLWSLAITLSTGRKCKSWSRWANPCAMFLDCVAAVVRGLMAETTSIR